MKDKKERVSMSFWTALGLSANNLLTKKGRTLLTAFAGSIGIIGIALILALSSGVSDYIGSLEEDTMAEYPLQITSSQFDISGMLSSIAPSLMGDEGEDNEDVEISVSQVTTTMLTQRDANDLAALKEYIESGESDILDNVKSVEYIYDVDPIIFIEEDNGDMRQVNPDTSFSISSAMSMMSSSLPIDTSMSSFFVMPENESLYIDDYKVLAGHWPENYNECVLVLSEYGSISDYILYTLNLRDYSELEALIDAFESGENAEEIDDYGTYTYDDVMGISFKVINSADLYAYDEEYDIWVDKSDNTDFVNQTASNGEDLTIVGVVKPTEDAVTAILSSGINYPYSLIYHMSDLSEESGAVQAQMANHDINIFTGEEFGEDSSFDFSDMFTIDEDAFADAFDMSEAFEDFEFDTDSMDFSSLDLDMSSMDFDMSSMSLDMSSIDMSSMMDMSSMSFDMSSMGLDMSSMDFSSIEFDMPEMDMSAMMGSMSVDPTAMSALANDIVSNYSAETFSDYLESDKAKEAINNVLQIGDYWTITLDSLYIDGLKDLIDKSDADAVINYISNYGTVNITDDGIKAIAEALITSYPESIDNDFSKYLTSASVINEISYTIGNMMDTTAMQTAMSSYMETVMNSMMDAIMEEMQTQMNAAMQQMQVQMTASMQSSMNAMMDSMTSQLSAQLSGSMESMMSGMMDAITDQLTDSMTDMMSGMMDEITDQLSDSMTDAFDFDSETMADMFGIDMESADFTDMLLSISGSTGSSYSANLASLGYMDLENPTEIDLYPIDFDSKDRVTEILDDYNDRMEANGEPEKVISYTDLVGTMMSTVTTIINTVSYVLMAFIGVSLVVSAIMISVITQISVMERTKEIGILRAMGASKLNISEVFNAETFIIGLCSGLLGVIVSEILIVPINMIIHMLTGDTSVNAVLPFGAAAGLVVLSFVITVISGLIPSYRASKQDPVAALRTE